MSKRPSGGNSGQHDRVLDQEMAELRDKEAGEPISVESSEEASFLPAPTSKVIAVAVALVLLALAAFFTVFLVLSSGFDSMARKAASGLILDEPAPSEQQSHEPRPATQKRTRSADDGRR